MAERLEGYEGAEWDTRRSSRERGLVITYSASQGDIVWLDFDPQAGHEQKSCRPAIVVSNNRFNAFQKVTASVPEDIIFEVADIIVGFVEIES